MKIKKFNESSEIEEVYNYEIVDSFNDYTIGGGEYAENFDDQDLKDTVRHLMEIEQKNKGVDRFHVRKVTYNEIDREEIEKIMEEIELENNTDKFNL